LLALDGLHHLDLSNTSVTDKGLATIADHPNLQSIEIVGLDISDAGLKNLQRIKSLKDLMIASPRVSQASLASFTIARPDVRVNGRLPADEQPVENSNDADEFPE
jgi:hypothetical protein